MWVVPTLKRFFELMGLITMGVGLSIISTVHSKNSVRTAGGASLHHIGVSNSCLHIVWSYFGGFVLLTLGLLVFASYSVIIWVVRSFTMLEPFPSILASSLRAFLLSRDELGV